MDVLLAFAHCADGDGNDGRELQRNDLQLTSIVAVRDNGFVLLLRLVLLSPPLSVSLPVLMSPLILPFPCGLC